MRHNWSEMRVNQDVTRPRTADGGQTSDRIQTQCLRGVTLTLASGQSRVTGDRTGAGATLQRCRVAWPPDASAPDLTDNIVPICPGLGPVPISADDQHCDDRCRGTRGSPAQCHSLVPTPRVACTASWVSTVCLNGLTPRLVTTNIGGLSLVCCHRARYLMSSQTEKPITTLYPLQPLTLACERICCLHFLSVQIILKFKWCGM